MQKTTKFSSTWILVYFGFLAGLSCPVMAQTNGNKGVDQRPPNYYKDVLMNDKNTGGPAPVRDLTGAWAGPTGAGPTKYPPMTPVGLARYNQNKPVDGDSDNSVAGRKDPFDSCDPLGFPRNVVQETRGMGFAQMGDKIIQVFRYQRVWREIWTDGRQLPTGFGTKSGPDPRYYGYSVGHWEDDDTLVVDTVGSDDASWLDGSGHPHSLGMKVEERYTRPNHNTLDLKISIDDLQYYTQPIQAENHFKWIPDQEIVEDLCVPSSGLQYLKIVGDPAGTYSGVTGSR